MPNNPPITQCDILIIGGGSAGSMAAIHIKEIAPDLDVLVLEKNFIKYSGCIARGMDALNVVALPGIASPETYVIRNRENSHGIVDDDISYEMAKRSYPMMQKLISWGVFFPQDEDGNYEVMNVDAKAKFCVAMEEPELKSILAKRMKGLGVRVLNWTMASELMTSSGRITGATAINIRTGEILVVQAKSVILTAGGTARFGLPSNGNLYGVYDYPGNTGDGYMLAYRAGAELSGFEYTLRYVIVKDVNSPLLSITLTRGASLLNGLGEIINSGTMGTANMLDEHMRGNSPLRIDMRHLPEEKIVEIERILFSTERPVCQRFFEGRGINFRNSYIELWPTEIFICGGHGQTGVRINTNAETCVPGLYAAGDNALCAHGYLTGAFTIGEAAAESAAEYVRTVNHVAPNQSVIDTFLAKVERRLAQKENPISIEEFEYKVRRNINDYLASPKTEDKLQRGMEWMDRFMAELDTMVYIEDNHDLIKTLEVENIITCAKLCARAASERKESRWGSYHKRIDYPERDDANWMKHIVMTMGNNPLDIRVTLKNPIRLHFTEEN